jgi:E3 ubiquitin-protein transferase RMND5
MESVQKEHEKVWRSSRTSKTLDQTQDIIDALQNARNAIVAEPTSAQITLAKLQNPVKNSFESINTSLKEIYGGHNKYTRVLDKLFKDKPLPSNDIDALSLHPTLVNRAIYLHLLREGLFDVAATFYNETDARREEQEANAALTGSDEEFGHPLGVDQLLSEEMQQQFASMYRVLGELKDHRNLEPAITWARTHAPDLEVRGSNLEFELCRLQYVNLFLGQDADNMSDISASGQMRALDYARREFQNFRGRYSYEIQQLMGAMAFSSNLEDSPYRNIFNNTTAWDEVATSFTREFCSLLKLSADSPLYIAATAGAIALPTLQKLQTIMQQKRTEWTTENELPVEIPLPPAYQFHSIFVCPVSKEQTTDLNPPMMMPCGHVVAQESLQRLSKGTRFKCPYCPGESHPRDARKVVL